MLKGERVVGYDEYQFFVLKTVKLLVYEVDLMERSE